MTAENIYAIAIHLPEKELEKLYVMLRNNVIPAPTFKKSKKQSLTRQDAIDYLLENVFRKK